MQLLRIVLHGRRYHPGFGVPPAEEERSALLLYFFSGMLSAALGVLAKLCTGVGVHFFTLVAARSSVLCLLILPFLLKHRINPFAITETFPLLLLRGFLGFGSLSLWYLSMALLPLSDANALSFVSPPLVAMLAPLVLGEATPRAVYMSLPACVAGMLMVAQPSWLFGSAAGPTSSLGVAAGIASAVFQAGSKLTIRALNKHNESLESILFTMGFVSTLGAAIGCLFLPGIQLAMPQQTVGWAGLAVTSVMAVVVQGTFTKAVQKCNASKAASLDYVQLIWALLSDGLVFRKLPNILSLSGAGVITAASLGSMMWTFQHPDDAKAAQQGAAAAKPQQYKKQYYLGGGRSAPKAAAAASKHKGSGGGHGIDESSSENEVVSLLSGNAVGSDLCWPEGGEEPCLTAGAIGYGDKGHLAAAAGDAGKHAAKLALTGGFLTDSSKDWRLGTEIESVLAAEAAAAAAGGGYLHIAGGGAGGGGSSEDGVCVELQSVGTGPAAMRTSTEKEQALQAAGK